MDETTTAKELHNRMLGRTDGSEHTPGPWRPIKLRPDPEARGYIPPGWYPWRFPSADTSKVFSTRKAANTECNRRNSKGEQS